MYGQKGFDYTFFTCRVLLGAVGLWPSQHLPKSKQFISSVLFFMSFVIIVAFVTIPQTARLITIYGELNEIIANISIANLPITVVVFKMLLFRSHRKALQRLLVCTLEDWRKEKSPAAMTNMNYSAKLTRIISRLCAALGLGSVTTSLVIRISQELNILSGPPEKRLPFLSSQFPYDCKPSPLYEITFFLQYAGSILATFVYSGIYSLFTGLVLHLHGQVANLRLDLEKLETETAVKRETEKWYIRGLLKVTFRHQIQSIVERHDYLNKFAADIENIFNIIFLSEILSCTVLIGLQLFLLVTYLTDKSKGVPTLEILFMIAYVMHIGSHVFICCYVCDKLRHESLSICKSAYNVQWNNLPPNDAKMLLMVMLGAGKPLQVTAGKFFKFSVPMFVQMIKTSGGYVSMLLAVHDRLKLDT